MILDFAEQLPEQCPPADAQDVEWTSVYRLVASNSPSDDAFKSHAALGKIPYENADLCTWASCSLFIDVSAKKKLPKLKGHLWVAKIKIPAGSGMSKQKKNHVDFWRDKKFSMAKAIVEVMSL